MRCDQHVFRRREPGVYVAAVNPSNFSRTFLVSFAFALCFLPILDASNFLNGQQKKYPELLGEFFSDEHRLVDSETHRYVVREMRNTLQDSKIHVVLAVIEKMSDYPDLDQDIETFTRDVANYWELGERKSKQGILVLFSIDDRKFHIAKTEEMSTKLTDEIKARMMELPVQALKQDNVSLAMKRAANVLVEVVPSFHSEHGVQNIVGANSTKKSVNRKTPTTRRSSNSRQSAVPANRNEKKNSSAGSHVLAAFVCIGVAGFMIVASFVGVGLAAARGFGSGRYHGGYHRGGGGFLSGMITGGLLGSLFGGSNHGWGSGYRHEEHHHHYGGDDGGGGDYYDGGGGGGFDMGGYDYGADTFGGGDFDGGSTGEW